MLKALKQVRAAVSLLSPEEVRKISMKRVDVGLLAATPAGYAEMEDFLVPAAVPHERRVRLMEHIHRAGDRGIPKRLDLVLCEHGVTPPAGGFVFHPEDPLQTIEEVLRSREEFGLSLARHFLPFRKPVVDQIVTTVSRENALFAVTTALPNIIPSLIEVPWAMGEFASDTAFLTINQVRMAFLVAAACDKPVGFAEQKAEIASIIAGAFGWRTVARELAGKMPLGAGLIPKGAIAFAGTYVIGKGLEHFHQVGRNHTRAQRQEIYNAALERGRTVVRETAE